MLTVNGKAEVVVQDPAAYQKRLEFADRMKPNLAVERGLKDIKAGRTKQLKTCSRISARRKVDAVRVIETAEGELEEAYEWIYERSPLNAER